MTLPVQISQQSIDHLFHISMDNECPAPVLLGSDFIHTLNARGLHITLDLFNKSIIIVSHIHRTIHVNAVSSLRIHYDVRVQDTVLLPKRSKNFIAVYHDHCSPTKSTFILEDNHRPSDSMYAIGRCLSTPENGRCPILVLNPSWSDITFYKDMNIAKGFPIFSSQEQISAINTTHFDPTSHQKQIGNQKCLTSLSPIATPMIQQEKLI